MRSRDPEGESLPDLLNFCPGKFLISWRGLDFKQTLSHIKYMLSETEYRQKVQSLFDNVESAFENIDPDVAECEQSFGALTIQLSHGMRCILSTQPSVRQIWLAVAARGVAYHFNYEPQKNLWIDDKNQGIELKNYLKSYLKDETSLELQL